MAESRIFVLFQKSDRAFRRNSSEMPIADLTKGMSINDRFLLYMNELFGGDMAQLDEVLRAVNNFPSLESAKSYLVGIADPVRLRVRTSAMVLPSRSANWCAADSSESWLFRFPHIALNPNTT